MRDREKVDPMATKIEKMKSSHKHGFTLLVLIMEDIK